MKKKISSSTVYLFSYFIGLAILGSLVLKLPVFYISKNAVPYIDCLFTAVSALCVTGLSSVDMSVYTNSGFLVIMLLIEAGGLGLITFFMFFMVLPSRKISLINRKFVKDYFISDVDVNPKRIIANIIIYTLAIQLLGSVLLSIFLSRTGEEHAVFYGLFISVSAFCNAGFAPYSNNLCNFTDNFPVCFVVACLIVTGGLGFTVMTDITSVIKNRINKKNRLHLSLHSHIVLYVTLFLILVPAIIFFILEYNNAFKDMTLWQKIGASFFQSVTTRTAGFEIVPQAKYSSASSLLTEILMIIGGSPGSMAGGVKTTTFFLTICYAFRRDDDINELSIFKRDISNDTIGKATSIVIKAILFLFTTVIVLFIAENAHLSENIFSVWSLVFEAISAFGTVGLSCGVTGSLSVIGKLVIIFIMLGGRTGVIALAISIHSGASELKRFTDYPEESVLVG